MGKQSKSLWAWLGCGCVGILGIGLILFGALAFFGVRTARTMSDPVARKDKALEILSAGAIPAGYETKLVLKIPLYAQLVLLEGDDRQFVFLKGLRTKADLKSAIADEESFDRELRRAGLQIRKRQKVLARDALRVGAAEVRYVLVDGEIQFDAGRSFIDFEVSDLGHTAGDESRQPELGAAMLVRCSEDDVPALGLWMGPAAAAEADPGAEVDAEDTTADQAVLVDFIEQLDFCR